MGKQKKSFNYLFFVPLIFVVGVLLAVFLLFLVNLIPVDGMIENAQESYDLLAREGLSHDVWWSVGGAKLDTFTDSLMINIAVSFNKASSVIENAMLNFCSGWGIDALGERVAGSVNYYSYPRYWHGYLLFLKPLLLVFNLSQIRTINFVLQSILVLVVCVFIFKKCYKLLFPYLISLILINPFVISMCMQFSGMFYIFNLSIIVLLILKDKLEKNNGYIYFFLIVGMLTSFIDLLTAPLITFLMPLVFVVYFDKSGNWKRKLVNIVKYGVCWGIGYFGFWIAKWVIGSLITKQNIVFEALNQAKTRVGGEVFYASSQIFVYFAFVLNLAGFVCLKNLVVIPALIILLIWFIKKYKSQLIFRKNVCLPMIIVACIPVLWYIIIANHSYMHYWFTYRSYAGSIFALLAMVVVAFDDKQTQENKITKEVENEKDSSIDSML